MRPADHPFPLRRVRDSMKAHDLPGSHAWVRPLDGGYVLTSGYGYRWGSLHPAQDFAVAVGTPVKAMSSGKIIFAG